VRLDPETGDDALFCVTCDIFVHVDNVVDPYCMATRHAPDGAHAQTCGDVRGHRGPHGWTCDHPASDGRGTCCLNADDPQTEGHEYHEPLRVEPRCASLVRTWPHGLNVRCRGALGHEGPHVADVRYFFDGALDGYEARWVRGDRFVEHVPDEDGVRHVLADEPPTTCGRCGSARAALGTVDTSVTAWRCEACAGEIQYDVLCEEDNRGILIRIDEMHEARE
jgi:hypothetical protein